MKWFLMLGIGAISATGACQSTTASKAPVPYESTTRIVPSGVSTFKIRSHLKSGVVYEYHDSAVTFGKK